MQFRAVLPAGSSVGEDIGLSLVHELGELVTFGRSWSATWGQCWPAAAGVVLREGGGDEGRDDTAALLPAWASALRMK